MSTTMSPTPVIPELSEGPAIAAAAPAVKANEDRRHVSNEKGRMTMFRKFDLRATVTAGLALTLALPGGLRRRDAQAQGQDRRRQRSGDRRRRRERAGLGGGGGKVNAEQIMPKAKKREISADAARRRSRRPWRATMSAKKSGGLSGGECTSVADGFKSAAEGTPVLLEALLQPGRRAAGMRPRGRRGPDLAGHERGQDQVRPRDRPTSATSPGRTASPGRAEQLFTRAIEADPLHTVEARNNLAQILRDKARHASSADEKKQYVGQAVSHLRTVLALDSNNLQAFSTLAFIYYEMNMLEMAKLVGNQAIKKADEIATGKFEEEKAEEAAEGKAGKGKKKEKKKESGKDRRRGRQAGEGSRRARGRHRRHPADEDQPRRRAQHARPGRAQAEEHQPRHHAVPQGGRR